MVQSVIERAYAIARSGTVPDLLRLKAQLQREGYSQIDQHLDGRDIRLQLRALITAHGPGTGATERAGVAKSPDEHPQTGRDA